MNRIRYSVAGAAGAVLAAVIAVPCLAGTSSVTRIPAVRVEAKSLQVVAGPAWQSNDRLELSAQVRASDLNLARPHDVALLQRRIEHAAQLVCTQIGERYPGQVDPGDRADSAACVRGAIDEAMSQAKVAAVVARAQADSGQSRSG